MWKKDFTQTSTRAIFVIGQFITVVLCIIYVDYFYFTNVLPDKKAKETYHQAQCFIISKKLSSKGHLFHQYRSDFLISYHADGAQYNRWVAGNGLDMSYSRDLNEQEQNLAQYEPGKTYQCWYDPEDPQHVMLVTRHDWLSTYPILFPAIISIFALYGMVKNLLYLMKAANVKKSRRK